MCWARTVPGKTTTFGDCRRLADAGPRVVGVRDAAGDELRTVRATARGETVFAATVMARVVGRLRATGRTFSW